MEKGINQERGRKEGCAWRDKDDNTSVSQSFTSQHPHLQSKTLITQQLFLDLSEFEGSKYVQVIF